MERPRRELTAPRKWPWIYRFVGYHLAAAIGIIMAFVAWLIFGALHASPTASTIETAIACPSDDDFSHYSTLATDDISAAIAFANDHGCLMLPAGTFIRVDHGSTQVGTNHVCIRPAGSYQCLWTFAAHIKSD